MAAKTVETFRTELMQEFGLSEDNANEGTSSDAILRYINEGNELFINHRAWKFRLKNKTQYIYPDATVDTQFTTISTQAILSATTNWGSAGRIFCDYDIIEFTANDNVKTLTIVSADIDRTHEVGERTLLMYELPADYNKIAVMKVGSTTYFPEDVRIGKEPSPGRFWEVDVSLPNETFKKYLVFPFNTTTKKIYFMYGRKATDYTAAGVVLSNAYIEIPEPYFNFIKHYVSARIYRHLEELNSATDQENKMMEILKKASIYDAKQHFGNRIPLRTEWDNPSAVLGIRNRSSINNRN